VNFTLISDSALCKLSQLLLIEKKLIFRAKITRFAERLFLSEDKRMRDMLLKAMKDPAFQTEFLNNPEAAAKKFDVKLKPDQIERIKKASGFIDSLNDVRLVPGPIFYPVDSVLQRIKLKEMAIVLKYWYIGYPADFLIQRFRDRVIFG
jgi:hypothetical protein